MKQWRRDSARRRDVADNGTRGGFTMVEMVIAGAILAFVVAGLFAACLSAMRTQYMAANYYRATCLARNRVQRGSSLPFETIPLLTEPLHAVDEFGRDSPAGAYRRGTDVNELSSNCYEIAVEVYYPSRAGELSEEPVAIKTMIARRMYDGGEM